MPVPVMAAAAVAAMEIPGLRAAQPKQRPATHPGSLAAERAVL